MIRINRWLGNLITVIFLLAMTSFFWPNLTNHFERNMRIIKDDGIPQHFATLSTWKWQQCNSTVHTIILDDNNVISDLLGRYHMGGTVIIYINNIIAFNQSFLEVLQHELGHHYWFKKMKREDKIKYCNGKYTKNLTKKECAEDFAQSYNC